MNIKVSSEGKAIMKTPKLCGHGVGAANLPSAATNRNDSANTSITWIVSDRAIGIKLKEAMGRGVQPICMVVFVSV